MKTEPNDSVCACGGEKPEVRLGCDDCEEEALKRWAAARPEVELPAKWWRRFDPWGSCGHGYYLFGRLDLTGKEADAPSGRGRAHRDHDIVMACENGVSITPPEWDFETPWRERVTFDLDHLKGDELETFLQILAIARADHLAVKALNDTDELAKLVAEAGARRLAARQ